MEKFKWFFYLQQTSSLSWWEQSVACKKFSCEIKTEGVKTFIRNLGVSFKTQLYNETCFNNEEIVNNIYFVDNKHIVRKSVQYHSPALGYLTIERLDRLK